MPEVTNSDFEVGVGLQPSKNDSVHHMGHFWIRWINPFTGEVSHRGYWPVLDDLPAGLTKDDTRDYLCNNKVRGLFKIDTAGYEIEKNEPTHKKMHWSFTERAFMHLTLWHCKLPDGASFKLSGNYSCSEKLHNTDNCSSWAIKALRAARKEPSFIHCDRIKRLKFVEEAIWG